MLNVETAGPGLKVPAQPFKDKSFCLNYYKHMVRMRALEERLIKMMRLGEGFFWIGGPGEEAFAVALGLQVDKGHGVAHDFLHLHYRSNGVALTMGAPMVDFLRQMRSSALDPFSGGRNFVSHICKRDWNIVPVTSTIETQYSVAPGTAMAQRRERMSGRKHGVTVVVGGDAGSAEGDFATGLVWSSRPGFELPLLMIVTNNKYGISTPSETQHGEKNVSDRGKAFGIETAVVDGNQPEKAWAGLQAAFEYVRSTGKPYLLELMVSRLNGHSSSSGGARVTEEADCIDIFAKKIIKSGWATQDELNAWFDDAHHEAAAAHEVVRREAYPEASTFQDHTWAGGGRGGVPGRDF
jgi:2-oxoisovalerate dehydrogenase E1 component alpha subunit